MKKQPTKPTGLAALWQDQRLADSEKRTWVDLCMTEHELGAKVQAMYLRRMAGTPTAPDTETYQAAHAEHLKALEAVSAMAQDFGGYIPYPCNKGN